MTDSHAQTLSEDAILSWFRLGEKTEADYLVGSEHEKFIYHLEDLRPANYDDIATILRALHDDIGGKPIMEDDKIVGIKQKNRASVTLEPGGQLELSGAPLKNLHAICEESSTHIQQMKAVCARLGYGMLGAGHLPHKTLAEIPLMPKARYNIMREFMPKVAPLGLEMMHLTTTIQVNLDYSSEADMVQKMRIAAALQPFATALFVSSPIAYGKDSGFASMRAKCWLENDPARTGIPRFIFDDDFSYRVWMNYLLDVPAYFVVRDGISHPVWESFRNLMKNNHQFAPMILEDFINHSATVFPDVRLKNFIEMRGADCSADMLCALPAFWVGLLYNDAVKQKTFDIIAPWQYHDVLKLRADVVTQGMDAKINGQSLYELAEILLPLAGDGLRARAHFHNKNDERIFLAPLMKIVENRTTIADQMRTFFQKHPDDFKAFFQRFSF